MYAALPNFPMKSQRRSPDANADFNCLPTCIASVLQFLTGRDYEPNQVKDSVYGAAYVGGTAAPEFVTYCAQQGVHLFSVDGTGTNLAWLAHQALNVGHPVIATEPDPYAPAWRGWSHVIVFHAHQPGQLTAMDPWTGADVTRSDQEWAGLFQFGQIWIGERMFMIPAGWKDDGTALTAPNGIAVVRGFRNEVLNFPGGWETENWPLIAEQERPFVEDANQELGAGTWQPFRWRVLAWTPKKGVYVMWTGQELLHVRSKTEPFPAVKTALNMPEVLATARLITESGQHLLEELQPPAPAEKPL